MTFKILGLYLHNKNQTETHLILMSTASERAFFMHVTTHKITVKMAQLMGLSRIPDEIPGGEAEGDVLEREVG